MHPAHLWITKKEQTEGDPRTDRNALGTIPRDPAVPEARALEEVAGQTQAEEGVLRHRLPDVKP